MREPGHTPTLDYALANFDPLSETLRGRLLSAVAASAESDPVPNDCAYGDRYREPAQKYDSYLGCPTHALILGRSPRWSLSLNGSFGAAAA